MFSAASHFRQAVSSADLLPEIKVEYHLELIDQFSLQ
jgi:hypothetical protein